ncbi:hypothetical protein HQ45_01190 [Porphyromonas crevioricanis]|uniref:Uncharacterized protein n=2 Tax=Porphyromonas crevioricanis TaxID=393921 RepID=A0AB34PEQ3_9PORP|nr:hypothetical protein [Porphyromonas crevioricanis]KGN90767.1 hypothetical protein HQ45_01190 [Porphyromonas crevioricanis]KGN93990.1 hypothetical protein HQ38_07210 [Porphyromonas crevioricanis]GAD05759.1 hypothetical protein PORCRE_1467 [Porphyromonas crevioricanis JCM 15906]SJZ62888.1 hypothetical protein SAMN02745203_00388 [Porphyromonas crevioricanis]
MEKIKGQNLVPSDIFQALDMIEIKGGLSPQESLEGSNIATVCDVTLYVACKPTFSGNCVPQCGCKPTDPIEKPKL